MLDVLQLHCCTSVSSLLLLRKVLQLCSDVCAMVHRCLLLAHLARLCLRLPKTCNTDVRNQGRGTVSDVSLLHNWLLYRIPECYLGQISKCISDFIMALDDQPSFLQSRACSRLNAASHPSKVAGILSKGRWYLIASASRNSVADKSKWCVHSGNPNVVN